MRYYNILMAMEADPYETLGVSRGAGLEEVRAAYRQAALKCHPDNCPGRRAEAARRFRELTEAYRAITRPFEPAARNSGGWRDEQTYRPRDFIRLEVEDAPPGGAEAQPEIKMRWHGRSVAQKLSYPTVNENRIFVCLWALAIAVAAAATYLTVHSGLLGRFSHEIGTLDFLIALTMPLAIYVAVLAATVYVLSLTRKIVWRLVQLALSGRRALPGPRTDHNLPPT